MNNYLELFSNLASGDLPIKMPNIPFPTMGGEVWWNNLDKNHGWRLQQNIATGLCRILDPNDIRRDWGTRSAMEKVFRRISENN